MKVDIWSDIRCPFCYIGKRKFELALDRFSFKDKVSVRWHSFQLDPGLSTQPGLPVYDYLARVKRMGREESKEMHDHVARVAKEVGLTFNFDKVVVANSFNGHRLIQFAIANGLGSEAEELLFKAHFTDGLNIDDSVTLIQIGAALGMPEEDVAKVVASGAYATEVKQDEQMARSLGIRAVPFFLFDQRLAISGAQAPEAFLQAFQKTWAGSEREKQQLGR